MKNKVPGAAAVIRMAFIVILMASQVLFLILCIAAMEKNYRAVCALPLAADLLFSVIVVNSAIPSACKLTWLVIINAAPIIGGTGYLLIRASGVFPRRAERYSRQKWSCMLKQEKTDFTLMKDLFPEYTGLVGYIYRYGGYPLWQCTSAQYYPVGELWFEAVAAEIAKAQRFIFMEFFIVRDGAMFGQLSRLLLEKARQGTDVRLLYDGIGTGLTGGRMIRKLREGGVQCREYNPLRPVLSSMQNNRDHRKLIMIDGVTVFSGGTNLADEYVNRSSRFGHWKDTAVKLSGKAAWNYTVMFLQLWEPYSVYDDCERFRQSIHDTGKFDGFVQPFSDSPFDDETVGRQVYLSLISSAERKLCITTPYFVPDDELLNAIIFAAKRGVDVKLITPHIPDKRSVHILTRSYYPRLIKAGVTVCEYTPGFIHAKSCISDEKAAVIGTINMDHRSLYMQYETAAVFYGSSVVGQMKQDFDRTAALSHIMTENECRRSLPERAAAALLRIIAPLL